MKWIAHFDNSSIKQFDDNGNEIKYQEVINDIDNLRLFVIMDNQGNTYSLDLKTKEFYYNEKFLNKCHIKGDLNFFYYRRNYLKMGDIEPYIIHCMGFENDKEDYFVIEIDNQTNQYRFSFK